MLIDVKPPASQCRSKMIVTSQAGILLCEYQCKFPTDHPGLHQSAEGATWMDDSMYKRLQRMDGKRVI